MLNFWATEELLEFLLVNKRKMQKRTKGEEKEEDQKVEEKEEDQKVEEKEEEEGK